MEEEVALSCGICDKTFSKNSNLRKHIKIFHNLTDVETLAPVKRVRIRKKNAEKKYNFSCNYCTRNFNKKHHLTFHIKQKHNENSLVQNSSQHKGKKCPVCKNYVSSSKKDLLEHFTTEHDIAIKSHTLEFDSDEDFTEWQTTIEHSTRSKFVKESGTLSTKDQTITKYVCHRSGEFISESKGLRRVKTNGSNKIGGFCPAGFKLTVDSSNKHTVQYVETHVGHQNDLEHLYLTQIERQDLADKISKIPFDSILDEVRDSSGQSSLERVHLITRKDLYNIEASFNLRSTGVRQQEASFNLRSTGVRQQCDGTSIESWVIEIMNESNSNCSHGANDNENSTLPDKKEMLSKLVTEYISTINTTEEFNAVQKLILPIGPTLAALRNKNEISTDN